MTEAISRKEIKEIPEFEVRPSDKVPGEEAILLSTQETEPFNLSQQWPSDNCDPPFRSGVPIGARLDYFTKFIRRE